MRRWIVRLRFWEVSCPIIFLGGLAMPNLWKQIGSRDSNQKTKGRKELSLFLVGDVASNTRSGLVIEDLPPER